MRGEYDQLADEERAFLQVARLLWKLGIRGLNIARIWDGYEDIFGCRPSFLQQEAILAKLLKKGFCSLVRSGQDVLGIHDSYLEQVIRPLLTILEPEKILQDGLFHRQDADAFQEIGNTWSEEYSTFYQSDPRTCLRRAIAAYEQALRFRTPDAAPLDYATTQNNLGLAYLRLAAHEQPAENLRRAIAAYEQALRFYTPDAAPLNYATTQNNLGLAYLRLAAHEQPAENLRRAIAAYEQALRFRTPEAAPQQYISTQDNLGEAYSALEEIQQAIECYQKALSIAHEIDDHWQEFSNLCNLGNANSSLGNYALSIDFYTRALQLEPEHARTYRNRADSYIRIGKFKEAEADCQASERLAPEHPFTHARWGQLLYALSDYPAAVERYRHAAALSSDLTAFNFDLALPLLCLGSTGEALQAIRARLEANPKPPDLKDMLPDFEALASRKPELTGLSESIELLRSVLNFSDNHEKDSSTD
jgi:tetratricopeptide (TPR) repeat protein